MTDTAATQSGQAASGQAAGSQQGGQPPSGQQGSQGGPPAAAPSGDQGQQASPAPGEAQGQPGQPAAAPSGTQAPAQAAPERYELRLPDRSPLDQADLDAVVVRARKAGLTNAEAQATVDDLHQTLTTQMQTFRTELEGDSELGGAQLEATQLQAKRFMDRFLPESEPDGRRLREAINKSGYGNWAPLVRMLARAGKAMGEDQGTGAAQAGHQPTRRSQADRLFGDAQGVQPPT